MATSNFHDHEVTVGVLALQGDVREHLAALIAAGARATAVRRPEELDDLDGLVVPGGESTTMGNLAETFGLLEPLRKHIAGGLPVFGSCAGMIMLADRVADGAVGQQTFGGIDVTVRRNAFGRQVDSFEADLDVAGLDGGPFHAVFIRAPWVEEIGDGVQVLARTPAATDVGASGDEGTAGRIVGTSQVVAVRQGYRLATSFHPELTGDDRLHRLFVAMVRERMQEA